jgi:hypothetical protein
MGKFATLTYDATEDAGGKETRRPRHFFFGVLLMGVKFSRYFRELSPLAERSRYRHIQRRQRFLHCQYDPT